MTAHATPPVSLRNATVRYGRKTVLDSLSFDFHEGEVVGLIGPGGSGKTQLFRVLSTLRLPSRGELHLFGRRVRRLEHRALREMRGRIGLQFQNFALFDFLTVGENVGFSLRHGAHLAPDEVAERVDEALTMVGLPGTQDQMPADLSGGMRRRVAIARVIAGRPLIAMFDDPVAGLDPVHSAKVMRLLRDYARQGHSLVLIASHDLERLLPVTTRTVALFDGRVEYDGPTAQLQQKAAEIVRDFVHAAMDPCRTEEGAP